MTHATLMPPTALSDRRGWFTPFDVPSATNTIIVAINNRGYLAKAWSSDSESHLFLVSNGNVSSFDVPVAGFTDEEIHGINNSGQLVALYADSSGNYHGFAWGGTTFTIIDYPGAALTFTEGIDNAEQIVGRWFDADFNVHGFVGPLGNKGKPLGALESLAHKVPAGSPRSPAGVTPGLPKHAEKDPL